MCIMLVSYVQKADKLLYLRLLSRGLLIMQRDYNEYWCHTGNVDVEHEFLET